MKQARNQPRRGEVGSETTELMEATVRRGSKLLAHLTERALKRALREGRIPERFFDEEETQALTDAFSATTATANLLGRYHVRRAAEGYRNFSEVVEEFAEPPVLPPSRAVRYFRNLKPMLGGGDPRRFSLEMRRAAFTLAEATDRTLLERLQKYIGDVLESGHVTSEYPGEVREIMERFGVSFRGKKQYAEMTFRTNMMDSYNHGQSEELQEPDMKAAFPAWQYLGIKDTRVGDDHYPQIGKFYSSEHSFERVRGPRVFNCRCSMRPVGRAEWERLQKQGVTLSQPPNWTITVAASRALEPVRKLSEGRFFFRFSELKPHICEALSNATYSA